MSNNGNISNLSMLPVGTTLQMGKYRIERYLASGGFGNTYVAKNVNFGVDVAIKEFYMKGVTQRDSTTQLVSVSNPENANLFEEQKKKFWKEANLIYRLPQSEHIVRVSDLFEENGTAYYVMRYINGQSLAEKIKNGGNGPKRLPQKDVYGYVVQILDALEVVHQNGIFHLDLKPANVMLDANGTAMLIDFGASKQIRADGEITETAPPLTPGYAPPEQMEQKTEKLGPWTDLYALGATIYNLLTAKKPPQPFEIMTNGEAALQFTDDIFPNLKQLVIKLMKPIRNDRFQSVDEVRKWMAKNIKKPEKLPGAIDEDEEDGVTVVMTNPQPKKKQDFPLRKKQEPQPEKKEAPAPSAEKVVDNRQEGADNAAVSSPTSWLNKKTMIIAACALAVALLAFLLLKSPSKTDGPTAAETTAVADAPVAKDEPATVENMKTTNQLLGECLYTGPVDADGLPHGIGKATFTSGDAKSYEGNFVHGVMEGDNAVYQYKNGDSFTGTFKANRFSEGKYTTSTGEYFVGKFDESGSPTEGTWYDKNGKEM